MKGVEAPSAWLGAVVAALAPTWSAAQSHEDVNEANNPLTPTIGLNLQDQWAPKLYGSDAEPQWTVAHDGDGQPKFQVFAGLNLQFPIGR